MSRQRRKAHKRHRSSMAEHPSAGPLEMEVRVLPVVFPLGE